MQKQKDYKRKGGKGITGNKYAAVLSKVVTKIDVSASSHWAKMF